MNTPDSKNIQNRPSLSLIRDFISALGSKIFFHANVNRKKDLAGERFITSRLEKCQNVEISRFYDSCRKLTID